MTQFPHKRGRRPSPTQGAQEAVDVILKLKKDNNYSDKELGMLAGGANQSSVNRTLFRSPPAWTPTLRKLWNYAKNKGQNDQGTRDAGLTLSDAAHRLQQAAMAAWDGTTPGLESLERLLADLRDFRHAQQQK